MPKKKKSKEPSKQTVNEGTSNFDDVVSALLQVPKENVKKPKKKKATNQKN